MTDTLLSRDDEPNWYFRVGYPLTEFRRLGEDGLLNIFIPVEGLSNYSLANTTPIRWENYPGLSEEDNLISFYAYVSTLSAQDVYTTTTLFRIDLNGMFQVYLSECSKDKIDREELANEIRKITRYVWFTSEEVFYAFIQRACPLIYSQIDRWKLLTELKEYSREIRVAEK